MKHAGRKLLSVSGCIGVSISLLLWAVLPIHAGRRDRLRRKRMGHVEQVAKNVHTNAETLLPRFLGIPQEEPAESLGMTSSLARLLGVPEVTDEAARGSIIDVHEHRTMHPTVPVKIQGEVPLEHAEAFNTIATSLPVNEAVTPEEQAGLTTLQAADQYEDEIEFYFENADLQNFVQQIEDVFEIKFITEDALEPLPQGGKSLKGNKISYRTHAPISRQEAWNTFNTFLNIAGFAVVPQADPRVYRIATIARAQKSPLTVYIGVTPDTLPDSDELIRYVYFIENNTVETIRTVVEQFRSSASSAVYLNEHRGFVLTDISYNIKKLMEVIKELDKVNMPESLSVLKLRRADARQVKELYDVLVQQEQPNKFGPRVAPKK
jgi:hypothetical protein